MKTKHDEMGFVRVAPGEEGWESAFDLGLMMAILHGDPSKGGIYVVRVKWPPGVMSRPHVHPEDRHVVVLSGTWHTGTGEIFDPAKAVPLKPGGYMFHPAGAVHWDGSKDEETVIQVTGYGPSANEFLQPNEPQFSKI